MRDDELLYKVARTVEGFPFLTWNYDADQGRLRLYADYRDLFLVDEVNGRSVEITEDNLDELVRAAEEVNAVVEDSGDLPTLLFYQRQLGLTVHADEYVSSNYTTAQNNKLRELFGG